MRGKIKYNFAEAYLLASINNSNYHSVRVKIKNRFSINYCTIYQESDKARFGADITLFWQSSHPRIIYYE